MIQFEDLTIDFIEHLPLLQKVSLEREIPFFIERFIYSSLQKILYLPKQKEIKTFDWIVFSINHEFLHHVINCLEGAETSRAFDAFGYIGLESGRIRKEEQ